MKFIISGSGGLPPHRDVGMLLIRNEVSIGIKRMTTKMFGVKMQLTKLEFDEVQQVRPKPMTYEQYSGQDYKYCLGMVLDTCKQSDIMPDGGLTLRDKCDMNTVLAGYAPVVLLYLAALVDGKGEDTDITSWITGCFETELSANTQEGYHNQIYALNRLLCNTYIMPSDSLSAGKKKKLRHDALGHCKLIPAFVSDKAMSSDYFKYMLPIPCCLA